MNIFVLDKDPKKAATQQIDKHIVKMPLESAQMLCAALARHGREDTPYKATHKNHPCTLWAGESQGNFRWLVKHGYSDEDIDQLTHYAYSALFGSGFYRLDDRSVAVLQIPLAYRLREPAGRRPGIRLLAPVTIADV